MFYDKQPEEQQDKYKQMLATVGKLTFLFSESDSPYLSYRAHENIFCKYFCAENLARFDCSADAKQGTIGIGLKTWTGNDDQKIAEFGKLKETYKGLSGLKLAKKVSEYRNERIRVTKNMYAIDEMIYHIVKRIPHVMQIIEHSFDYIDIDNISILKNRGNINNTYFTDGKHTYHFSSSKNTLYMLFKGYQLLDEFDVTVVNDPYNYLMNLDSKHEDKHAPESPLFGLSNILCLRLYSSSKKRGKFVPDKSGLNQWNAAGRKRNPNEVYISYPSEDRKRKKAFFPPRDTPFELLMPDGSTIQAKVCQEGEKAIMSNPNKKLGEWLLRTVFELPVETLVTYEMLEKFGIDSVVFTKLDDKKYKIDFAAIGTYEDLLERLPQD